VRVLVTGIGGFAGPVVAEALRAAGHEVHGLVRGPADRDRPRLAALGLPAEALHVGDLRDPAGFGRLVAAVSPEGIVHLAGMTSPPAAERDPEAAYRANLGGTLAVLGAVRQQAPGARLLVVSSGHVYGAVREEDLPVTEEAPLRPVTVYGASKAAADLAAFQWGHAYGLDVVRARPFNHTGPGQDPAFVCSALARQMAMVEAGRLEVVRVGNLDPVRDFCDVRDVAAGYVALLERGRSGEAYNLCRGKGASVADVVAILRTHARVAVRVRVDPALRRAGEVARVVGSPVRAGRDTGWEARVPLEETLAQSLAYWRALV
jgi:GDP-4-dehydro-6-deoxy-D-mannose reductase